ncbi:DUF1003 domain-containing protein [Microvirga makkahensis]|uniref:DUF1003 domain-containing protein n=1 Tax=Microvirga makkahensis TaxID=1128670 RepID=A0A7X3MSJ8_9HYPH|nr:DUF1003 domain-containing protein [Microvirga makkahensis]MXQ12461.1 DUF1003 domain-containing protein [Microvirga makkahensis]
MKPDSPSTETLGPGDFTSVLERNINILRERRQRDESQAGLQDRLAEAITRFSGSMVFVYLHLALVGAWTLLNAGLLPGIAPFDPTFVILATIASVEAIFLSTFVLISQNRAAAAADRRAELDLQTNLLSEHEITRLLSLTRAIAQRLGVDEAHDPSLDELEQHVAPEKVLEKLAQDENETDTRGDGGR